MEAIVVLKVRIEPKGQSAWSRARSVLVPSSRVAFAGSSVLGGWSAIHAAQLVDSTTVVTTFALPMAIGALSGAMLSNLREIASALPKGDIDWVERIRIAVLAVGAYSPLYRFIRGHPAASAWYAFVGGALVMYALVLLLQLLKGPSLDQQSSDT